MNNTISNLYNTILKKPLNNPSTLKVEGLVSNIQVLKDGQIEITVLTEEYPLCLDICACEELFEKALGVSSVIFCINPTNLSEINIINYLPWALRHLEKKDFFLCSFLKAAIYENQSESVITISLHEGCEDVLEKGTDKFLSEFFLKSLRKQIRFIQQACPLNIGNAIQDSFKEKSEMANKSRSSSENILQENKTGNTNPKQTEKTKDNNIEKNEAQKNVKNSAEVSTKSKLGANAKNIPAPTSKEQSNAKSKEYKKIKQPDGVIWGKMNQDISLVAMNTFTNETGPTMMEGYVFGVESRLISNGTKSLLKFCLTDLTNSIRCFAFMKPEEASDFEEEYKKSYLRICAEVGYDAQYEKDLVARVTGIQIATKPKEKGDNAKEKRVELHCHTKMSSKDSVCDVANIIKLAVQYGHEAVAITDHGVVQAFPDARVAQLDARKKGKAIKIIYGVECYMVEDGPCAVYQCNPSSLEKGFVAIEIITTGPDFSTDRIVKINAVLFENNENEYANANKQDKENEYANANKQDKVNEHANANEQDKENEHANAKNYANAIENANAKDHLQIATDVNVGDVKSRYIPTKTYSCILNPGIDLTDEIIAITGVSQNQILQGVKPFDALVDLERFISGRPIVGHDVLTMVGFLRYEGFRTEKEQDPRIKFFQPVIDTLKLARIFFPKIQNHNLDNLKSQLEFSSDFSDDPSQPDFANPLLAGAFLDFLMNSKNVKSPVDLNLLAGNISARKLLSDTKNHYHCILLAKDQVGLYGLYRLISESHLTFIYKDRPRIARSLLEFYRSGMLFGSACEAGEIFVKTMELYDKCNADYQETLTAINSSVLTGLSSFYDYLEIQPTGNNQFMLRTTERKGQVIPAKYKSIEDLKNLNRLIINLGEITKKTVCATCDVHFLQPADSIYREIMQSDMGFADASLQPPLYFRNTDEMIKEFEYLGEDIAYSVVIKNPKQIAAKIKDDMKPFPEGTFPPVIATAAGDIEELTWQTARKIYEKNGIIPEIVKNRVEKELKSIIGNGFAIMYYIAHKLVKKSNDDGYIVGSRGSVGSSFVATLCGITEVNPLEPHYYCPKCQYSEFNCTGEFSSGYDMPAKECPDCSTWLIREGQDIPFETFLGFDGDKQPDIDLNFSGEYQPTAHKFIEEMFGSSHTFRAGTISGYAEKNAVSMVMKYCSGKDEPVTKAESLRLANGLIGVKRTTGQHPGGIVVVPKERDIYDFTPVQCPADKTENGIITTHFDFNSLHDTILKLDILGHDDPTMLKVLGDMTNVDVRTIPIPDDEVMKLFLSNDPLKLITPSGSNNGTLGLPELGTFMARGMIKDTKPTRFYDLVQLMGLSHGTDVWKGNAQDLILNGTCSISEVIGCRDSIMTSLMYWGLPPKTAFFIMEKVRKGKGLTEEQESLMEEKGVPQWYIESCKKIKYMFPKAHAAAYSISALRIAWFKVYHKAEYYCAFFTVRADEFDSRIMCRGIETVKHYREKLHAGFRVREKLSVKILGKEEEFSPDKAQKIYYILELIEEMYARGVEFLPVDIYKSDAVHFRKISDSQIRPPLNTLPSLSETVANNILAARIGVDKFLSREDFAKKAGIGDSLLQLLSAQGCLDDMPETTQMDLFSLFM